MCVRKANGLPRQSLAQLPVDDAAETLIGLMNDLPVSERSGCALGLASRLIEFAAFEMAGTYSADEVAELIDCAAQVDHAATDVQTAAPAEPSRLLRRMQ